MNSRNSTGRGILANSSSNNACSEIRSHGSDTVSPQPNALGAFDNALEKNHRRSVGTSATVMTSGSDKSSHLSDAGDTNNQRKTRRRYRRSLTDQGYNRFLTFWNRQGAALAAKAVFLRLIAPKMATSTSYSLSSWHHLVVALLAKFVLLAKPSPIWTLYYPPCRLLVAIN